MCFTLLNVSERRIYFTDERVEHGDASRRPKRKTLQRRAGPARHGRLAQAKYPLESPDRFTVSHCNRSSRASLIIRVERVCAQFMSCERASTWPS